MVNAWELLCKRRLIVGVAVFLLAACSTAPSLRETMDRLNQRFAGHNAGEFFLSYGRAVGKVLSQDGGMTYRWVSIEPPETRAEPVYRSYPAPGGKRFSVVESGESAATEPQFCELKIQADRKDVIRDISVAHDSIGKHSNSLCAEILQ